MQAIRKILKTEKGKVTIDIPEYLGEEVEVIILPVTEELSDREFDLLTLNYAFEDDESEDKIWERYLTLGNTK